MGYIYDNDGNQVWDYSDRDSVIRWFSDTRHSAAEALARRVEEYLFDRRSPVYQDPSFLAWSVAAYDHDKSSSGGPGNSLPYEPSVAYSTPLGDHDPNANVFPKQKDNSVPVLSEDAKKGLKAIKSKKEVDA